MIKTILETTKTKSQSFAPSLPSNWHSKASRWDWRGRMRQGISFATIGRWRSRPSGLGFWSWAVRSGGEGGHVWLAHSAPALPCSACGTGSPKSQRWLSSARLPDSWWPRCLPPHCGSPGWWAVCCHGARPVGSNKINNMRWPITKTLHNMH